MKGVNINLLCGIIMEDGRKQGQGSLHVSAPQPCTTSDFSVMQELSNPQKYFYNSMPYYKST